MKQEDSAKQVALHLALKFRLRSLPHFQGYSAEIHSIRLVEFFQAVNEWAALDRGTARVIGHPRIRFEYLGRHFRQQMDAITR
jgi:hypothetical protein